MTERLFRIRTITVFVCLDEEDFDGKHPVARDKLSKAMRFLLEAKLEFVKNGYTVQTLRVATNPFGLWFKSAGQIDVIDAILDEYGISFCSIGPAASPSELPTCLHVISEYERFSCSADLDASDVLMASECAKLVSDLTKVQGGLGNFRFCVAASASANIPFFPVAKAAAGAPPTFAIGLENGSLAHKLLSECGSLQHIPSQFSTAMSQVLQPLQDISQRLSASHNVEYAGIDTSLNPSLDDMTPEHPGSIAGAMECLAEIGQFGGAGSLAAAAAITTALQSLPNIQHCGYSGIMLPVCEDKRLASLSESLSIPNLLSISHVCGVGVDTVPIPGNTPISVIASLFLDVAGMAHRWKKSLSCRIFPVVGKTAQELTEFDSPYMVNASILPLD